MALVAKNPSAPRAGLEHQALQATHFLKARKLYRIALTYMQQKQIVGFTRAILVAFIFLHIRSFRNPSKSMVTVLGTPQNEPKKSDPVLAKLRETKVQSSI